MSEQKVAYAHGHLPGVRELFRGDAGILYLSGPMTGLPEYNYPAFHAAAARLRHDGYTVLNPAEIPKPQKPTWENYMRHCIRWLTSADSVAVLPGWESSKGARIEVDLAISLGMRIVNVETLE